MALAKGARMRGAQIFEGVKVTGVTEAGGRVTGVDYVTATAAGAYRGRCGHQLRRHVGPRSGRRRAASRCRCMPASISTWSPNRSTGLGHLPVLRVPDECAYYKQDAGKMMLGAFEPKAKPWGMDGIREDFCFDTLPEDWDHFKPILEMAMNRMPLFQTAGIHTFFNGPESFTPDDRYYLGEAPELEGYWIAAGYNSIGIVVVGRRGAWRWRTGSPKARRPSTCGRSISAAPSRSRRTASYLKERVTETLGLLYADHFPYRQVETARGVRRTPLHEHLKARGAVFGEVAGWERANWFARAGQEREYRYSWKRQNWFENQKAEHMAVRNGRGPVRHDRLRQDPGRGARCLRLPQPPLFGRDGRGARADRLHDVPERARRDRGRPDGDAPVRDRLSGGGAGGDAAAQPGLDAARMWARTSPSSPT